MMFIKYAAFHLQHLNLWKNQKNTTGVVDNVIVCLIYV
jgi:hypothetical protein